jgi:FkbM family methyltransferase
MTYTSDYAQGEFKRHGEEWLQEVFSGQFKTIFDVGSNIGEWTKMTRRFHPNADIHTFEVMAPTFRKMLDNIELDSRIYPNPFGLSDDNGPIYMKYKPEYDAVSTSILNLRLDNSEIKTGLVIKGDDYVNSREIEQIDFMKVDTEGAEGNVFRGLSETLSKGKIKMIQFEYGYICVLTKWLLKDSYEFLGQYGYSLGKLSPGRIDFHEYRLTDEDFQGPDYVAIHDSIKGNFGL